MGHPASLGHFFDISYFLTEDRTYTENINIAISRLSLAQCINHGSEPDVSKVYDTGSPDLTQ